MDIKNYIASGILELYVLDKLSEKERLEVEANALQYPEVKAEIEAIEIALETYAMGQTMTPKADSFDQILKRIEPESESGKASGSSNSWLILTVLLAAALAWGAFQYFQHQSLLEDKQIIQSELEQLQADCEEQTRDLNDLKIQLEIIRAAGNQAVKMEGSLNENPVIATVHWNNESNESYLDLVNWPSPPSGQQYQLWAIIDGVPTDMGPIDLSLEVDSFVNISHIQNAQAFAVSLEPIGGSESPTNVLMIQNTAS